MHADGGRPEQAAPVAGDQADLDVRISDACGAARDDDVATEHDRGSQAHRVAVQSDHDGHWDVEQRVDDPQPRLAHPRTLGDVSLQARNLVEIAAGRKRLSLGAEKYRAYLGFAANLEQDREKIIVHLVVDRIEQVRAIQSEPRQLTFDFVANAFVLVHGGLGSTGIIMHAYPTDPHIASAADRQITALRSRIAYT